MKANFDFNRLSESRKQELDRMAADFSEAGCLFVEDLFLEFLIDADNGIDRSDDKLVATFDNECGHELVFILSQEEVHYVIHAISEKLDSLVYSSSDWLDFSNCHISPCLSFSSVISSA